MPYYSDKAPFKRSNGKVVRLFVFKAWNKTSFAFEDVRTFQRYISWALALVPSEFYPPTELQYVNKLLPLLGSMPEVQLIDLARTCECLAIQAKKSYDFYEKCQNVAYVLDRTMKSDTYSLLSAQHLSCFEVLANMARNATKEKEIRHVIRRTKVLMKAFDDLMRERYST